MNTKGRFVLKSTLIGFVSFFIGSLLHAHVFVTNWAPNQPHSLENLYYLVLPIILTAIGTLTGFVSALFNKGNSQKQLVIVLVIVFLLSATALSFTFANE